MARNWEEAQERERVFWKSIYVEKQPDIPTYRPITEAAAHGFAEKSLTRLGYSFDSLAGKTIADVGCGPYGIVRGVFDTLNHSSETDQVEIYAIDPLMDTYRTFGSMPDHPTVHLVAAKGEENPVADNIIDIVFSTNALDHVESPDRFLKTCQRICKQGGEVALSLHVTRSWLKLPKFLLRRIDRNHPHHFTEARALKLIRRTFDSVTVTYRASIIQDQPDFSFAKIFSASDKVRATKRWISNYVLQTIYVTARNSAGSV